MATIVKKNLPEGDSFGRWGGEEFVIIATNQTAEHATQLAERIRKVIENHVFDEVGSVTASFGISTFTYNHEARAVVWRADVALYQAKVSGRNTVKVHLA